MMDLTPKLADGAKVVQGYAEGRFRIGGEIFPHSVLVMPGVVEAWQVADLATASVDSLEPVLAAGRAGAVEVLIIGCGPRTQLVPRPLREALKAAGIGVEGMDTGAAARTYNVMTMEDRKAAAALIVL
ncbi:Mth938-like domain-containing protein [Tistrella mobilis]|uniref:NADH dehydrogenase [ubiquinone] 1 alpha subcomplex assembly factor n=1 Tax=Tistrella mobilis (strain KA081020-065) TaxID=1110502 RepID=I3TKV0_TISMK|nr:Mth938-like domain-containing protein [Tistrella mobilis]AFK53388.1 NADH dehydrogenase [ubiquinone] 1 alpha subcomplex assembly factor [Tistrella mobilis KA081020-065]